MEPAPELTAAAGEKIHKKQLSAVGRGRITAAQDTSHGMMWEGDFIPQFLGRSSAPQSK